MPKLIRSAVFLKLHLVAITPVDLARGLTRGPELRLEAIKLLVRRACRAPRHLPYGATPSATPPLVAHAVLMAGTPHLLVSDSSMNRLSNDHDDPGTPLPAPGSGVPSSLQMPTRCPLCATIVLGCSPVVERRRAAVGLRVGSQRRHTTGGMGEPHLDCHHKD